jgi:diadenosine tetraphosphate (Ap4A) HIT family hydrolase
MKAHQEGIKDPFFIHEFEHCLLVLGPHQYYPGYSLVFLKQHAREITELDPALQSAIFKDVMTAGSAVNKAFQPWKLNYSCYGNQVEHIHWHIFPRYWQDPHRLEPPFNQADQFAAHSINASQAETVIKKIKQYL